LIVNWPALLKRGAAAPRRRGERLSPFAIVDTFDPKTKREIWVLPLARFLRGRVVAYGEKSWDQYRESASGM
jgi:hypothetical protein